MAIKVKISGGESERKFKGDLVVAFCVDERKGGIEINTAAIGDFSADGAAAIGEGIASLIVKMDEEEPIFGKYLKMGLIKTLSEEMND